MWRTISINKKSNNLFASCDLFFLFRVSALKKLRNSIDIEDDIMEMRAEEQAQMAEAKITLFELVTSPTLKFPLLIAVIMQLSQQLSGINAVIDVNFLLI